MSHGGNSDVPAGCGEIPAKIPAEIPAEGGEGVPSLDLKAGERWNPGTSLPYSLKSMNSHH